jgi:hypothetical protein
MRRFPSTGFRLAPTFLLFGLIQCGPGDRLAGGSEIGNPVGMVMDGQGNPRPGVTLTLLPEDFNPITGSALAKFSAVTDVQGRYGFPGLSYGNYALTGVDAATGFRFLTRFRLESRNLNAGNSILQAPVKLVVEIPDSTPPVGFVYLPGTESKARIDVVGRAVIDSAPAGNYRLR